MDEGKNSPPAENIMKTAKFLPTFNVEKRMEAQERMIEKLIEENQSIYMRLCAHEALIHCGWCGHKVTVRLKANGYTCEECNKLV